MPSTWLISYKIRRLGPGRRSNQLRFRKGEGVDTGKFWIWKEWLVMKWAALHLKNAPKLLIDLIYIYMYTYTSISNHEFSFGDSFFGWELRLWAVDGLTSQKVQQNPKSLMIRARVHWLFMCQKFQGLLDTHLCRVRSFEFVINSYQVSLAALSNSWETSCKLLLVSYGWLRGWY